MDGQAYVYIMASGRNGTLYFGSTNALARRACKVREIEGLNPEWEDLYDWIAQA